MKLTKEKKRVKKQKKDFRRTRLYDYETSILTRNPQNSTFITHKGRIGNKNSSHIPYINRRWVTTSPYIALKVVLIERGEKEARDHWVCRKLRSWKSCLGDYLKEKEDISLKNVAQEGILSENERSENSGNGWGEEETRDDVSHLKGRGVNYWWWKLCQMYTCGYGKNTRRIRPMKQQQW